MILVCAQLNCYVELLRDRLDSRHVYAIETVSALMMIAPFESICLLAMI
jgi:hypothetical protein